MMSRRYAPLHGKLIGGGAFGLLLLVAMLLWVSPALASGYQLYAFGWNPYGELGNTTNNRTGNPNPTPTLVTLPGASGAVVEAASGDSHTLALTSTGQLYAFGENYFGQLGNPANTHTENPNPTPTPVMLPGASGSITQVAAGSNYSLALTSTNQLYGFGTNESGELGSATNDGDGNSTPNPTPMLATLPAGIGTVTQIAAGEGASFLINSTGQLYSFGWNAFGQLGYATNDHSNNPNPTPTLVTLPGATGPVTDVAAGDAWTLALTSTGQLYSFGDNPDGQLGYTTNSGTNNPNPTPTQVTLPGASGQIVAIAAGQGQSLALTSTGQLYAFGENEWGQLGSTTNVETANPNPTPMLVTVPGASGSVTKIGTSLYNSYAVTSTGQLFAFGNNYFGQLGMSTSNEASNPVPMQVTLPGPVRNVGSGGQGTGDTLALVEVNPPTVTGVSPDAGLEAGGTSVTITGTELSGATKVVFGAEAAHVTSDSATSITATSPAETAGTVNVTVETADGTSAANPEDDFTYVAPGPAPTVTKLSVKKGPAAGGTSLTITGTGFVGVTAVDFGSTGAASFTVNSPTTITVVSGPETTGKVDVTVTTPNGTSATSSRDRFTFERPTVSGVSPNTGSTAGGYQVTVTGSGFGLGASTVFKFGKGVATSVNCTTTTSCTMLAPTATKQGTVEVLATAGGKTSKKSPATDQFTYS